MDEAPKPEKITEEPVAANPDTVVELKKPEAPIKEFESANTTRNLEVKTKKSKNKQLTTLFIVVSMIIIVAAVTLLIANKASAPAMN